MAFPYDTKTSTSTLLERSFACSKSDKVDNKGNHDDGAKASTGRECCNHPHLQFGTPRYFRAYEPEADEPTDWIVEFVQIARANNWSSSFKLNLIPVYFVDNSTKVWFEENREEWGDDFDAFRLAFKARFGKDAAGRFIHPQIRQYQYQFRMRLLKYICYFLIFVGVCISPLLFASKKDKTTEK
ncbi:hypothetical protein EMPS_00030 [Entomortierella parvispora]|uniref:Uncharacterized protein n=1 Tax=Entomortierella parvispora TaxID=205924 RepID=A0A9P3GYW8_9FUNG|nr:hypothetical protein EMPS_00030 [Entomortierella parvispora]